MNGEAVLCLRVNRGKEDTDHLKKNSFGDIRRLFSCVQIQFISAKEAKFIKSFCQIITY